MSEMEYNRGTLTLVSSDVKSFCQHLAKHNEINGDYDLDDTSVCRDFLGDEFHGKYVVIRNKVFHVDFAQQCGELYQINNLTQISPTEFEFETYHYNGGGHWTELVEKNFKKREEEEEV